jgi:hypothetical protein
MLVNHITGRLDWNDKAFSDRSCLRGIGGLKGVAGIKGVARGGLKGPVLDIDN